MPTLIMSKVEDGLDPSMKKKAYAFLEKLQRDDTLPGLHIEPIKGSVDSRVRTGRVDDNYRCVMFKIVGQDDPVYVIHGTWPHDTANAIAESVQLSMNPINGVPEVTKVLESVRAAAQEGPQETPRAAVSEISAEQAPVAQVVEIQPEPAPAWPAGLSVAALVALGFEPRWAGELLAAPTESALSELIDAAPAQWQGLAALDLATGHTLDEVRADFNLIAPQRTPTTDAPRVEEAAAGVPESDAALLESLRTPAAAASFHEVQDKDELRDIIEAGDLGAWRIFLHPAQKKFVDANFNGPALLRGGAGTGKTVVAIHRARRLAAQEPTPRVLLTTYTRNLADDLAESLKALDANLTFTHQLGEPGVNVSGIDALIRSVLQRAVANDPDIEKAVADVLGLGRTTILKSTKDSLWRDVVNDTDVDLPHTLLTPAFLTAEYVMVVLRHRITSAAEYVRVRREGRGVSLGRNQRAQLWQLIEAYRARSRADGTTDFAEKAAIAARYLEGSNTSGRALFDHVVVDEAQDLTPVHLQVLRALVAPGANDLFISEDSHQRIYGQKVTLGHLGIDIRGRSKRLTLNYRTTLQNLHWALGVLSGGDYTDLEGEKEEHRYLSARKGPVPQFHGYPSLSGELQGAADLVRSWLPTGTDDVAAGRAPEPQSIAILVRDRYRRENVVSGLAELGLETRAVDRDKPRPGMPVVMTMHRAKGLEFTHVLLFGVQDGAVPAALRDYETSELDKSDAQLRERSLLYVAATRARDVLAVSWSGEKSELIR